jgi:hypothetical protein
MNAALNGVELSEEDRARLGQVVDDLMAVLSNRETVMRLLVLCERTESAINPDTIPKIQKLLTATADAKCLLPTASDELPSFFAQKELAGCLIREGAQKSTTVHAFNVETGRVMHIRARAGKTDTNVFQALWEDRRYALYVPHALKKNFLDFQQLLLQEESSDESESVAESAAPLEALALDEDVDEDSSAAASSEPSSGDDDPYEVDKFFRIFFRVKCSWPSTTASSTLPSPASP